MKPETEIRRALETIHPSDKLKKKTLDRARLGAVGTRRAPWPLAVNGVLAILVLAITFWTLGDAGLFTRGGTGSINGTQENEDVKTGTTTAGPQPPKDGKDPGIAVLPVGVPDLSLTVLSADGRMSVYCVKNKYSVMMSDIIGLNIQPYLMQDVPAIGMLVYEVTASSGTLIDDRAFQPSPQFTVITPAITVYTDPVKTMPGNVVTVPKPIETNTVGINPSSGSAATPSGQTAPLSEYAFPITGFVRINGNPELVKTIRLFWSPLERDTIPEPGIDATVTIQACLESGTGKIPVSTMTLSVKYNTAGHIYAFDPKPVG